MTAAAFTAAACSRRGPEVLSKGIRGERILDLLPLGGDEENCRDGELELVPQEPLARVHVGVQVYKRG